MSDNANLVPPTPAPTPAPRTRKGKGKGLVWGAGLLIVGVFGWLIYGGIDSNIVYFLTPSELQAKGAEGYDTPVRVGGMVQPGSVKWDAKNLDLRFNVYDAGTVIPVHSKGAPPQMFQDGIGVVLEGKYARSGVFESTTVMVKHSNEYKPPKDGAMPAEVYKDLKRQGAS